MTDSPPPQPPSYVSWILRRGRFLGEATEIAAGLARALRDFGIPVDRLFYVSPALHPLISVRFMVWNASDDSIRVDTAPRATGFTDERYLNSPIRAIWEDTAEVRRRLSGPDAVVDFPILEDLAQDGATDFIGLPVLASDGDHGAMTLATWAEDGFSEADLEHVRHAAALVAPVLEARAVRATARVVATTYLGRFAGESVLRGSITRGDLSEMSAVILFADMRDFTGLSARLSPEAVLETVNGFFTAIGDPVIEAGGEILKFIGDGLLAVFPHDNLAGGVAEAADVAVTAASRAAEAIEALNAERAAAGLAPIDYGLSLHYGRIYIGNVGAPERMDFTVIGPPVNLAARIEALCPVLGRRPLLSAAFATAYGGEVEDLGEHEVKGVKVRQRIYTLAG